MGKNFSENKFTLSCAFSLELVRGTFQFVLLLNLEGFVLLKGHSHVSSLTSKVVEVFSNYKY